MQKQWIFSDMGIWKFVFLFFLCAIFAAVAIEEDRDHEETIHLLMTNEEKHLVFGRTHQIPEYEVVWPSQVSEKRTRRIPRLRNKIFHDEDLVISVATKDKKLLLHLQQPSHVVISPLTVEIMRQNKSETRYIMDHPQCLYHGTVKEVKDSVVALSTCSPGEMMGLIHLSPNDQYVLVPVPHRFRRSKSSSHSLDFSYQHILYKNHPNSFCGLHNQNHLDNNIGRYMNHLRTEREAEESAESEEIEELLNKTIETAVFVDDYLYGILTKSNPDDPVETILNMVFAMINAVQIIYNQPSLSVQINLILVKVVILTDSSSGPNKEDGNIHAYLKSFCSWQAKRNIRSDHNEEHWDHALMLTGLDLYMDKPDNTVVIGLAWVSGMCHHQYSCSLNEGTTFESVYVISHELGHNLGMQHDGEDNNECQDNANIMSSSLGPGKTTWSTCSDAYLRKFLSSSTSKCLDDLASPGENLDHRSHNLPGEEYTAMVQCNLCFGAKFKPYVTDENPFDDICRELWCANGTIARRAHPALVGTRCGHHKFCFQGKCMMADMIKEELQLHDLLPEDSIEHETSTES